ncbi:MAG: hypothetical protein ACLFQV_07340 [Vulcanimicrobiota bacterium]
MKNTEEIFKILSQEKKDLKPSHKYKTAQEALLSARHFFRWARKNDLKTLDQIVEAFEKKKVPEAQLQHFGTAYLMHELYDTDEEVIESLKYINGKFEEKNGKKILENIEPPKVERRVLKNIASTWQDAIDHLETRTEMLEKTSNWMWIAIVALLIINLGLVYLGHYEILLLMVAPELYAEVELLGNLGPYFVAILFFIIPSFVLVYINRHKIKEHSRKANEYPQEIQEMMESFKEFKKYMEEKNIQVKSDSGSEEK